MKPHKIKLGILAEIEDFMSQSDYDHHGALLELSTPQLAAIRDLTKSAWQQGFDAGALTSGSTVPDYAPDSI